MLPIRERTFPAWRSESVLAKPSKVGRQVQIGLLLQEQPLVLARTALPPHVLHAGADHALVHPATCAAWRQYFQDDICHINLSKGSDCVVLARLDDSVEQGSIVLDSVSQHNLHVAAGERYDFRHALSPAPLTVHGNRVPTDGNSPGFYLKY